jgi:hypothetical protein
LPRTCHSNIRLTLIRAVFFRLAVFFYALGSSAAETTVDSTTLALPPTPRLLLNSNGLAALKQRITSQSWAKSSWAELLAAATKSLDAPVELPPRGGNWSHNYVCPVHGARLNQGKRIGPWRWEHICPVGRHVLKSDPSRATLDFDGNAIAGSHFEYAQQTVNDGLVFQVTGDARFADKARAILMAYCERYLTYPLHDNQGRPGSGGRVASQSLTEATWLIEIAQGADLIWSTLSEAERRGLEEKVLRPALEQVILPRRLGIHNIQCRHNSAIGLVGYLLCDQKLIATALDDPQTGFRQQLEKGVRDDGMWLEGSSGYHYFTIAGLWPLAEAARNCGLELYTEKLRRMFDGPLALAMPDMVLPNFNDSGTVPLRSQVDLYELAFARFHNPDYLPLLSSSERRGRLALLFGADSPSTAATKSLPPHPSRNLPSSGYAILQRGDDQTATWLCLKYGPHGGGHGHPDKNTFILYSRGRIVATDAGTHAYGSPLHRDWDKTTLAHNTLVVDETSQEPSTGRCIAFGSEQDVDYAITDAGPICKGVVFTRTAALLNSNLVVFVDQIRSDAAHTYDMAYHQMGTWAEVAESRDARNTVWNQTHGPGYSHFTQARVRALKTPNFTMRTTSAGLPGPAITICRSEPTDVINGYGILKTTEDTVPMLLQRRHTQNTAFVWAISLDGAGVELETKGVRDQSSPEIALSDVAVVQVKTRNRNWSLLVNPQQKTVMAADGGRAWQTQAPFAVR